MGNKAIPLDNPKVLIRGDCARVKTSGDLGLVHTLYDNHVQVTGVDGMLRPYRYEEVELVVKGVYVR